MRYKVTDHDNALIGFKIHAPDYPAKIINNSQLLSTTALHGDRVWQRFFMPDQRMDRCTHPVK